MTILDNAPDTGIVALIAEFTARPGNEQAVADLLAGLAADVRTEPGNLLFDCYQHAANPAKFFVYETYRNKAAFAAHLNAAYGVPFNARLQELIVEPHSVLTFLRPV